MTTINTRWRLHRKSLRLVLLRSIFRPLISKTKPIKKEEVAASSDLWPLLSSDLWPLSRTYQRHPVTITWIFMMVDVCEKPAGGSINPFGLWMNAHVSVCFGRVSLKRRRVKSSSTKNQSWRDCQKSPSVCSSSTQTNLVQTMWRWSRILIRFLILGAF